MNMKKTFVVVSLLLGMAALAAAQGGQVLLNAAGATFPYPIYSKWFDVYHTAHPNVQINYQSIGSGGGIRQLQAGTVDFGASDGPMNDEQLKAYSDKHGSAILHFPTVLGAAVPTYNIPGVEDVEDVIVSSGPNTWPNWRNFSDRIIQPGDIVFMDLAALTWNGYKSCYYRTYCVGKEPSQEQKDTYSTALKWLYDSIGAVKAGATTRDIALKWPSAMETWGYEDEDQAAANLWGHGLGLAQYDPPVISRIWSLDHPVEIQEGMTFALETQHGKKFHYGVRIEEMLIVKNDGIEIVSNFPVKQITVVDPLPGYGDHVK